MSKVEVVLCKFCNDPVGIQYFDSQRNIFCGSKCRYQWFLQDAFEDAVRLIEHLGGNPARQIKALDEIKKWNTPPVLP